MWPEVLPTAGEVMMVTCGLNADLNIETDEVELIRGLVIFWQGREEFG
jgi:hypothetical protein